MDERNWSFGRDRVTQKLHHPERIVNRLHVDPVDCVTEHGSSLSSYTYVFDVSAFDRSIVAGAYRSDFSQGIQSNQQSNVRNVDY